MFLQRPYYKSKICISCMCLHTTQLHGTDTSRTLCINQCSTFGTCSTFDCNSHAANECFFKHFDIIKLKKLTKCNTAIQFPILPDSSCIDYRAMTEVVTLKFPVSQTCWKMLPFTFWFNVKDRVLSRDVLQTPTWKTWAEHASVKIKMPRAIMLLCLSTQCKVLKLLNTVCWQAGQCGRWGISLISVLITVPSNPMNAGLAMPICKRKHSCFTLSVTYLECKRNVSLLYFYLSGKANPLWGRKQTRSPCPAPGQ